MFNPSFVIQSIANNIANNIEPMVIAILKSGIFAPIFVVIVVSIINVLMVGLFVTFIYVMCETTPIIRTLTVIINQLYYLIEHINWLNVAFIICIIINIMALVYYTNDIVDKIDRVFENFTVEIADRDIKIRQLEHMLQNMTDLQNMTATTIDAQHIANNKWLDNLQ